MSPLEAASYWLAHRDREDFSPREQGEFETWLKDPVNAAAYAKAEATWALFSADMEDPHLKAMRKAALAVKPATRKPSWRVYMAGAIAASVLGLFAVSGVFDRMIAQGDGGSVSIPVAGNQMQTFETAKGERLSTTLPDGTVVTLNTDTKLEADFSGDVRTVRLLGGQAFFEVAHDAQHPFVVHSGDRMVTALGTKFDVLATSGRFDVVLLEGKVAVDRAPDFVASTSVAEDQVILLPGQKLVATAGGDQRVVTVDVERQSLWRDGLVEFEDIPLAAAIAEMRRYTDDRVVMQDQRVGDIKVSGVFRTGQMRRFLDTVAEILPVQTRDLGDQGIELVLEEGGATGR